MADEQWRSFAWMAALTLLIAGCATPLPERDAPPANTVAVAETDVGLAGRLNTRLAALGWALVPYQSGQSAGTPGPVPADLADRARYRLELRAEEVGACGNLEPNYIYDIRLIDNRDDSVAARRHGRGCEIDTARRFGDLLRQRKLVPSAEAA